ncbi:probable cyclin-dependent serine/threonine-protein kinase DDB_G0292550 [Condylostylus longicornis]|uniref:probable cyclin-dependent serine/threonine-protein kinase DDB_G0292550 n=1 Tax=Condylostylus longicornis TaxID=2530218 RepID=UPI00244E3466|nr:probable cyclin-dependent serine/threonine-protein kinase DDB_G0292550 [Condylostylus longicornis]
MQQSAATNATSVAVPAASSNSTDTNNASSSQITTNNNINNIFTTTNENSTSLLITSNKTKEKLSLISPKSSSLTPAEFNPSQSSHTIGSPKPNQVSTVLLYGIPIVSLYIESQERLCLAQISNTLLKQFSYNEIHNRRVALGITCVQCTPVQLEILRRAGAMPVSSRRCGMITRREAERLCKSFLGDNSPPRLPDDFAFNVHHECAWGCRGSFLPSRYNSSRAKCIKCSYCGLFFSPNKFIFHSHRIGPTDKYIQPDAANFNSWRRHMKLSGNPAEEIIHAWEDVKAMFNGGTRKRLISNESSSITSSSIISSSSSSSSTNHNSNNNNSNNNNHSSHLHHHHPHHHSHHHNNLLHHHHHSHNSHQHQQQQQQNHLHNNHPLLQSNNPLRIISAGSSTPSSSISQSGQTISMKSNTHLNVFVIIIMMQYPQILFQYNNNNLHSTPHHHHQQNHLHHHSTHIEPSTIPSIIGNVDLISGTGNNSLTSSNLNTPPTIGSSNTNLNNASGITGNTHNHMTLPNDIAIPFSRNFVMDYMWHAQNKFQFSNYSLPWIKRPGSLFNSNANSERDLLNLSETNFNDEKLRSNSTQINCNSNNNSNNINNNNNNNGNIAKINDTIVTNLQKYNNNSINSDLISNFYKKSAFKPVQNSINHYKKSLSSADP